MIGELLERGLSEAGASDDERGFAYGLADSAWEAHERFMAYTSGAREVIEDQARRVAGLVGIASSLETRVQDLEGQVVRRGNEVAALQRAGEGWRLQAQAAEANLENRLRDMANLESRLDEARRRSD